MNAPLPWAGRRVLVTGGTSGTGFAVARGARARGADVVVTGRDPRRALDAADHLASLPGPGRVGHAVGDCVDHAVASRVVAEGVDLLGGLDVLVSAGASAAGFDPKPFARMTPEEISGGLTTRFLARVHPRQESGGEAARDLLRRHPGERLGIEAGSARPGTDQHVQTAQEVDPLGHDARGDGMVDAVADGMAHASGARQGGEVVGGVERPSRVASGHDDVGATGPGATCDREAGAAGATGHQDATSGPGERCVHPGTPSVCSGGDTSAEPVITTVPSPRTVLISTEPGERSRTVQCRESPSRTGEWKRARYLVTRPWPTTRCRNAPLAPMTYIPCAMTLGWPACAAAASSTWTALTSPEAPA